MSTGLAEARGARSGVVRAAVATLVSLGLLLPLVACTEDEPPPPRTDVPVRVQSEIQRTLEQRGSALVERNEERFRGSLRKGRRPFVAAQETYFANLAQLPIAEIDFRMDVPTLVQEGDHYWSEVLVSLEISGYDAQPVVSRDRFRFTRSRNGQRYLVSSTTDEDWEGTRGVHQHPWDLGPIRVRRDSGVLGIFDEETVDVAENVLDAASFGRFDVAREVPDAGLVDVIVYATSDLSYLEGLAHLPVDDPQRLDAVTIPVLADASRAESAVASYRIMVHPRTLTEELSLLDRLMRHELTHVAVRERAEGVPLWLSEGIAEWVSVQPVAPDDRRLPTEALALARSDLDGLPSDQRFSGDDARAWYGVAWWICEYVATTYDRSYLWQLLDEFRGDADADDIIGELLALTPGELVDRAMAMMRRQYAPEPSPTPEPTPTPTPTPTDPMPSLPTGVTESATVSPSASP